MASNGTASPGEEIRDLLHQRLRATLELEDGTQFEGFSFGATRGVSGECVFQTGMVGYPESLTDPSYRGQILVLTFPLIGNYGVPSNERDQFGILRNFESEHVQISALLVQNYCDIPSHWASVKTLGAWLKENNIPGLYGLDTRGLTKRIREKGCMLGRILFPKREVVPWDDPNKRNLVAEVSCKEPRVYGDPSWPKLILAVDCGMKLNQLRHLLRREVRVKVVPWNHDILSETGYDGLYISSGPGDPALLGNLCQQLKKLVQLPNPVPIFGICLGHQLFGIVAGGKTFKMKFGHRGQNQPCIDSTSKRCHLTMQNHGYAVDASSISDNEWKVLFSNANDGTNEGLYNENKPFFSVQFHPEHRGGPRDTTYLFDKFIAMVQKPKAAVEIMKNFDHPLNRPAFVHEAAVPKVNKVLILGSGALSIGQAGEFDYSGSLAIKALKEEGISTVLINPNVATVQTTTGLADKIYFLPVTPEFVTRVIDNERPDAILVTFGGQTALNCGIELYKQGIFEKYNVRPLGTPMESIIATEDREIFANKMEEIGEKIAPSLAARSVDKAKEVAQRIGYPVIIRAGFALGGLGSGFANNESELVAIVTKALSMAEQVLIEKSLKGWKEIEYEVVRDAYDNCITVTNMENFDPLGIHTGESIVVAPSQTLTDQEYHMLRSVAIKVIRHLKIVGECNIQYALNPLSKEYCIIEVNARLSRSSALASKATGYPLAFVAAKLVLGTPLDQLRNSVTKVTTACFEPSLDYVVVKIPVWDMQKFEHVKTKIGSAMKSVGEVMALGRSFEEALQKAVRMWNPGVDGFVPHIQPSSEEELEFPSDKRLFVLASAFQEKMPVDKVYQLTKIDKWFLHKLNGIIQLGDYLSQNYTDTSSSAIPKDLLLELKQKGFSDRQIAKIIDSTEGAIRNKRIEYGITPFVKQIDTVSAEVSAQNTNYLYMTYNAIEDDIDFREHGFMVIGSGGYRIGSSVEFDWCAVSAINTVKKMGYKTIMVNYNPETVSTDYDVCDRLYFEDLSLERVLDIYEKESSSGVILSMGGQIPNNLAIPLSRNHVKILGTNPEMIDAAENRYKFSRLLDTLVVDQPRWKEMSTINEIEGFCNEVGFPVLVRPSYVLSGAAMNVVYSLEALHSYIKEAVAVSKEHPVVVSKFIEYAKEIEVDAVADGGILAMHCISEHVENAGVHSGDATLVFPAQDLDNQTTEKVEEATRKIAKALHVTGPFNIQFLAKDNQIKVIECNLRASRSFPFVSKTLQYNLIELATRLMMAPLTIPTPSSGVASASVAAGPGTAAPAGAVSGTNPSGSGSTIDPSHYPPPDLQSSIDYVGVKVAQFSFSRLQGADPVLGVEMTSTGEVGCFGKNKHEAFLKALLSTGFKVPKKNIYLSMGAYKEKLEFFPFAQKLINMGFTLYGSPGTADFYRTYDDLHPLAITSLDWPGEAPGEGTIEKYLANNNIHLCIICPSKTNTSSRRGQSASSPITANRNSTNSSASNNNGQGSSTNSYNFTRGYLVRRSALDFNVPLVTNVKFAKMLVDALGMFRNPSCDLPIARYDQRDSRRMVILPGLIDMHIHVREPGQTHKEDWDSCTACALSGGFTMIGAMPNTSPAITDVDSFALVSQLASSKARCDYGLYVGGSSNNPQSLVKCFGAATTVSASSNLMYLPPPLALKLYLDETFTTLRLNNLSTWIEHFKAWPKDYPICCHAEGSNLAAVILIASLHDRSVHVCHVSRKDEIEVIKAAKEKGIKVTCEVTPHHLFLDEKEVVKTIGPKRARVCPKLNSEEDRRALWENIKVIDCIATDHAPHLVEEKDSETPPPGFPGLETVLALLLTAVHEGKLTLEDIVDKCYTNPRRIFNLPEQPNTYVEVNLDEEWKIPAKLPYSKCGWTPFEGRTVRGKVRRVVLRGEIAYIDGKVLSPCGSGHNVREVPHFGGVSSFVAEPSVSTPTLTTRDSFASPTKRRVPLETPPSSPSIVATSVTPFTPSSPALGALPSGGSTVIDVTKHLMLDINTTPSLLSQHLPASSSELAVQGLEQGLFTQGSWEGKSVLSIKQFSREEVHQLFNTATELKLIIRRTSGVSFLKGKVLANLFYEPSTRTACSFAAAMNRLGGSVISVNEAHSSVQKGESLLDTIKTLECYADVIVLRHPQANSVQMAAKHARVPIINAGDGIGEHPTQALLDVFTIREELGTVNGLTVTLLGDLKHGRTVHSLVQLLSLYKINHLHYVSPPSLRMPRDIMELLAQKGIKQTEHSVFDDDLVAQTDVLYVTRIQKERFTDLKEYQAVESSYVVTPRTLKNAKEKMAVMHPLPRVNEISTEVDSDPRAAYFRQMENGMYVRMALFAHILGKAYS